MNIYIHIAIGIDFESNMVGERIIYHAFFYIQNSNARLGLYEFQNCYQRSSTELNISMSIGMPMLMLDQVRLILFSIAQY